MEIRLYCVLGWSTQWNHISIMDFWKTKQRKYDFIVHNATKSYFHCFILLPSCEKQIWLCCILCNIIIFPLLYFLYIPIYAIETQFYYRLVQRIIFPLEEYFWKRKFKSMWVVPVVLIIKSMITTVPIASCFLNVVVWVCGSRLAKEQRAIASCTQQKCLCTRKIMWSGKNALQLKFKNASLSLSLFTFVHPAPSSPSLFVSSSSHCRRCSCLLSSPP